MPQLHTKPSERMANKRRAKSRNVNDRRPVKRPKTLVPKPQYGRTRSVLKGIKDVRRHVDETLEGFKIDPCDTEYQLGWKEAFEELRRLLDPAGYIGRRLLEPN
jgi:hypothetical protein